MSTQKMDSLNLFLSDVTKIDLMYYSMPWLDQLGCR